MVKSHQFEQGDIIKMNFNPASGHEQKGWRPAIVISNGILNQHSSLIMVCPITNTDKQHPFHIPLDERTVTTGVILCDQTRMLDVSARDAQKIEKAPDEILGEVIELIKQFL